MKNILWLSMVMTLIIFTSCKHQHPVDEDLKKAYDIQQEALRIGNEVDSIIGTIDSVNFENIKRRKEMWVKSMIEIEGFDHDHTNCNHDHKPTLYEVSSEEMILVQQGWKDSITQLRKDVLNMK